MATEGGQHCTGPQSLQTHLVYTWQHPLKPVRLAVESGGWEQATSMHLLIDGALKTGGVEPPWCVYRRTGQTPIKGLIVDRYRELGEPNGITRQTQQERLKASFMVRRQVCSASIIGRTNCEFCSFKRSQGGLSSSYNSLHQYSSNRKGMLCHM